MAASVRREASGRERGPATPVCAYIELSRSVRAGPPTVLQWGLGAHLHSHHHGGASGRRLIWSFLATGAFVIFEFGAGVRSHSLALISDAGHNATDALALLLAWFAVYVQRKPADISRTFGYQRAGVLAAFV